MKIIQMSLVFRKVELFGWGYCKWIQVVGAWRSLVAHSLGVREVGRSNRLAPTSFLGTNLLR